MCWGGDQHSPLFKGAPGGSGGSLGPHPLPLEGSPSHLWGQCHLPLQEPSSSPWVSVWRCSQFSVLPPARGLPSIALAGHHQGPWGPCGFEEGPPSGWGLLEGDWDNTPTWVLCCGTRGAPVPHSYIISDRGVGRRTEMESYRFCCAMLWLHPIESQLWPSCQQ